MLYYRSNLLKIDVIDTGIRTLHDKAQGAPGRADVGQIQQQKSHHKLLAATLITMLRQQHENTLYIKLDGGALGFHDAAMLAVRHTRKCCVIRVMHNR